jgi:hypothetical protein
MEGVMFTGPTFVVMVVGALRDGVVTGQRTFIECKTLNTEFNHLRIYFVPRTKPCLQYKNHSVNSAHTSNPTLLLESSDTHKHTVWAEREGILI